MPRSYMMYAILFVVLVLLQVLIFNHIALFNVAFPIIFIYFIIRMPISMNQYVFFTLAFLLGFIIDIFSDTLGVNALSCTILAGIKQPAFYAYVDRDDHSNKIIPSVMTLGLTTFAKYLITMVTIYCLLVFTIEYFSFADVKELVVLVVSSTILTFITLLATDLLIPKT